MSTYLRAVVAGDIQCSARARAEAPGCGRLAIGQRIKSIVGLDCARHMEIKNSWVVKASEGRAFFGSQGNTQPLQPTAEQSEPLKQLW